jgi:hypothetical protein
MVNPLGNKKKNKPNFLLLREIRYVSCVLGCTVVLEMQSMIKVNDIYAK